MYFPYYIKFLAPEGRLYRSLFFLSHSSSRFSCHLFQKNHNFYVLSAHQDFLTPFCSFELLLHFLKPHPIIWHQILDIFFICSDSKFLAPEGRLYKSLFSCHLFFLPLVNPVTSSSKGPNLSYFLYFQKFCIIFDHLLSILTLLKSFHFIFQPPLIIKTQSIDSIHKLNPQTQSIDSIHRLNP